MIPQMRIYRLPSVHCMPNSYSILTRCIGKPFSSYPPKVLLRLYSSTVRNFQREKLCGDYYNHTAVTWQIDKGYSEKVNNLLHCRTKSQKYLLFPKIKTWFFLGIAPWDHFKNPCWKSQAKHMHVL